MPAAAVVTASANARRWSGVRPDSSSTVMLGMLRLLHNVERQRWGVRSSAGPKKQQGGSAGLFAGDGSPSITAEPRMVV